MKSKFIVGIVVIIVALAGYWMYKIATSPAIIAAQQAQQAIDEANKVVDQVKSTDQQGWIDWATSKLPSLSSDQPEQPKDPKDETPSDIMNRQFR